MLAKLDDTDMRILAHPEWSEPVLIEEPPLHVLLTEPSSENKAFRHLNSRKFAPYLPLESRAVRGGPRALPRLRVVHTPIFRGYIFVDMTDNWNRADSLHELPGLRSKPFMRCAGDQGVLLPRDVRRLKSIEQGLIEESLGATDGDQPHCFKAGEKVKFVDMMFDDYQEFEIASVDSHGRIRVKMKLFGAQRDVPVPAFKLVLA